MPVAAKMRAGGEIGNKSAVELATGTCQPVTSISQPFDILIVITSNLKIAFEI